MLRGIYSPTDFMSSDKDPTVSVEDKLAIIAASPVELECDVAGGVRTDSFTVTLPFVDGGCFDFGITGYPETVLTDHVNVGDAALYGHGIGSRLLRAALRYAVEQDARITELHTGWARLGLINTVVAILGGENVSVEAYGNRYGWGSDRPLETVLDDYPPVPDETYMVNAVIARIDREVALTWELPKLTPTEPVSS